MYTLYHNEKEKILKVKKAVKAMQRYDYTDEVTYFNSNYYICKKRKPLVEKAKGIKQSWIKEAEETLEKIKAIKI